VLNGTGVAEALRFGGSLLIWGAIEFPPAMTMSRGAWVRMVVVVPAFAARQDCDHPIVAAFVIRLICAVAPQMRCGVHQPGDVPNQDRAHEYSTGFELLPSVKPTFEWIRLAQPAARDRTFLPTPMSRR
jgi:hypothetical protein